MPYLLAFLDEVSRLPINLPTLRRVRLVHQGRRPAPILGGCSSLFSMKDAAE
jgi:hypothetical protein